MRQRGFTLVEVLVTLALLALVLSLVQGVYSGVTRSSRIAQNQIAQAHAGAMLLQRLSDELGSALPDSIALSSEGADASKLEFTTELPDYGQEQQEDSKEKASAGHTCAALSYELKAGDDGVQELVRRSGAPASGDVEAELGEGDAILKGLSRFRVQVSTDGKEWDDTIDASAGKSASSSAKSSSTGDSGGSSLPKIVMVEIGWRDNPSDPNSPEQLLRTAISIQRAL